MDRETAVKIAKEADCDLRSVLSYVAGLNVRPSTKRRIEAAMKTLKIRSKPK